MEKYFFSHHVITLDETTHNFLSRPHALPSLCLRPGFAYLDNFNQDISNPTTNTFDQYQWYLTGLNQVSTELGAFYILPNGNQLGLSYRWRYLTSRTSVLAPYRFEQAGHALLLTLDFALN